MHIRLSLAATFGLAILTCLSGCVADDAVEVSPVLGGEVEPQAAPPPATLSYDPSSDACPAQSANKAVQKKVHLIVSGILNGGVLSNKFFSPVGGYPCTGPDGDPEEIRFQVAGLAEAFFNAPQPTGSYSGASWITVGDPIKTNVCGLETAKRQVKAFKRVSGTTLPMPASNVTKPLAEELNKCWGVGHRAFFHITNGLMETYFDPEPVKLTANLSGSAGTAQAAGVFINNNNSVNVLKWYSSATVGTVAGGTPCTTGNVTSLPFETMKEIIVLPYGYRECR